MQAIGAVVKAEVVAPVDNHYRKVLALSAVTACGAKVLEV